MSHEVRISPAILVLAAIWICSVSASPQDLQGRFYPEKETYMVGEPVIFNLEIKNTGKENLYVNAKDPSKCLDTYEFSVRGPGGSCSARWDGECGDEEAILVPGDSFTGHWPLNFWFQFERDGKYQVRGSRHIPIRTNRGGFQDFTFSSEFEVNLKPASPERVRIILEEFERNLHSTDFDVRHAALDVLSTTAASYFQETALRLSRDEDPFVVLHAVGALGRLNTPEASAALADVIAPHKSAATIAPGKASDYDIARIRAIEALGRSGDASYEGFIEHYVDDKNQFVQLAAMVAVTELGKREAIPQLQRLLLASDPIVRRNAAYALRFSTAPEAVETLINAIPDKNSNVRECVLISLNKLTGQSFEGNGADTSAEKTQGEWLAWWRVHKDTFSLREPVFLCHLK